MNLPVIERVVHSPEAVARTEASQAAEIERCRSAGMTVIAAAGLSYVVLEAPWPIPQCFFTTGDGIYYDGANPEVREVFEKDHLRRTVTAIRELQGESHGPR